MNVRRSARIRDGLDSAENIFAGRAGDVTAEALEIRVALIGVPCLAVKIRAILVTLPDLDRGIADGLTVRIKNLSTHPGDFADCGSDAVINDQEIIISIEWKLIGIKRAFGLAWRPHQFFSEEAGNIE